MTDTALTGHPVIEQSRDNGLFNTNAAVATGAVVGVMGAVASIAAIGGWIGTSEAEELKKQAGIVVPSVFVIAGIVQGAWTRYLVWSGKTATKVAVANTNAAYEAGRAGEPKPLPTLAPPP